MTDEPLTGTVGQQLIEALQDIERLQKALEISCQNVVTLTNKCTAYTNAIMRAMTLIDELVRENGRLCAASDNPPPITLFAAKSSFDLAMKTLLGEDRPS